jgi:hypothetical protein
VEKRKHYWNGRWGRLARRDVLLFADGGRWRVEHRVGGAEGRSQWTDFDHEDDAFDTVRDLLGGVNAEEWRELM